MKKFIIFVCVIAVCWYFAGLLAFQGVFDKKYTREELTQNFIDNEKYFFDLVKLFNEKVPENNGQIVTFGLGKRDKVSLTINPTSIGPAYKIIGGDNLKLGSPELELVLMKLGWTNETIVSLRDNLRKTNCDWIRTNANGHGVISVYPNQSGWGTFSYAIFNRPIVDSMVKDYGKPISNSEFGSRVVLNYTSAL